MSEENKPEEHEAGKPESEPQESVVEDNSGAGDTSGNGKAGMSYPQYLAALYKRPDELLDGTMRGLRLFGLINMSALLVLIALSSFVQRIAMTTTSGVRFSWLLNGIKFGLSFAIPIAIVLFALQWYAKRQEREYSLDFFIEKFGTAMALPAVLVAIAIPLNLLGVTMHSWFRGAGLFFIYIGVFLMSYLFVAPQRLKVAVVFTLAFYFAYRLIWLLM
ncbi:hypothetical protein IC757_16140 [Wenzhouxiangella sp. AB-CW3]|uniref:hypothetical protein n=1 Tax=Wenzhouxiangella sp. AB-CW3 TaxID=2771012 RepID=UPI00168BC15A|nr:hypothetical protein [Wenzhouxiangella sp. AB-CW3]QOC22513.1 hypothetical protein IC757_16140 [Wenzhouxiangella sp. AB-CW3]